MFSVRRRRDHLGSGGWYYQVILTIHGEIFVVENHYQSSDGARRCAEMMNAGHQAYVRQTATGTIHTGVHIMYPTPCKHGDGKSLCDSCQDEYDTDPDAWEEFGYHAAGEKRWLELQAEIANSVPSRVTKSDPSLPF